MNSPVMLIITAFMLAMTVLLNTSSGQSICGGTAECGFNLSTTCIDDSTTPYCMNNYLCHRFLVVDINYCCQTDNTDQCPHGGEILDITDCKSNGCDSGYYCMTPENVCCPAIVCPSQNGAPCGNLCNSTSCNQGLLCCNTGCGQECQSAVSATQGFALPQRWWLPTCYRGKVDDMKTYMNRLANIFSVCTPCFSSQIIRKMAELSECLQRNGPYEVLRELSIALEKAEGNTSLISEAILEAAYSLSNATVTGDCGETAKIRNLVGSLLVYSGAVTHGLVTCSVPKICRCKGDPHCTMFDGEHYTYAQEGFYYLLSQTDFTVVAEFKICRPHVSCVYSIEITSRNHNVTIHLFRNGTVSVDGREQTPPYIYTSTHGEINIDNFLAPDRIVVELSNDVEIVWDEAKTVELYVPANLETRGMCGNNDDNQHNDYRGPNDEVYTRHQIDDFGRSWEVPGQA